MANGVHVVLAEKKRKKVEHEEEWWPALLGVGRDLNLVPVSERLTCDDGEFESEPGKWNSFGPGNAL